MRETFDVLITNAAEQDLELIHSYLALHGSVGAADRLIAMLYDRIAALETYPRRGAVPREALDAGLTSFRQLNAGPYRLIYQIDGRRVLITLIIDGRRDVSLALAERILRDDS